MGKEKSAAKAASIATRHNPIGRPVSGSQFFPSSFDDDAPEHHDDPNLTPTHTPSTPHSPLREPSPLGDQTKNTVPTAAARPDPLPNTNNDERELTPSRAPSPMVRDPPLTPLPTPSFCALDRDLITSFLEVADRNRSMVAASPNTAKTKLTKYTPAPDRGFPIIHLASPGQLLADLKGSALMEWLNVNQPKFLVRIFDYDGGDPTKMNPVITHRVKEMVNEISVAYNARDTNCVVSPPTPAPGYPVGTSPNVFLVHNVTEEIKDTMTTHRIWSSATLTFEARPFAERALPTLLLTLAGFTTNRPEIVQDAIQSTWADPEVRHTILIILHDKDPFYQREEVMAQAVRYADRFIASVNVEFLDYKVAGGIETPRFNVYADSPTTNPDAWTAIREFLMTLYYYPTSLYGTGTANRLFFCTLCHSVSHPRGLCDFPSVPYWNGPVIDLKQKGYQKDKANASKGKRRGN